jgi:hypothetical protein
MDNRTYQEGARCPLPKCTDTTVSFGLYEDSGMMAVSRSRVRCERGRQCGALIRTLEPRVDLVLRAPKKQQAQLLAAIIT